VADAYASLTDARPFRDAFTERQAREHLLEWTGLEFDPRVVRTLLALEPFKELNGYAPEAPAASDLSAHCRRDDGSSAGTGIRILVRHLR